MYCNFNIFNIYCKRFTDLFRIILKIIYLRQNFTGAIFPGWNEVTERGHQKHRLLSYILITDDFRIYSTRKALRTSCWTHSIFIFFAELTLNHQYVRIGFDSPFSDKFRSQRPGTIWKSFKERSCACLKTFFIFQVHPHKTLRSSPSFSPQRELEPRGPSSSLCSHLPRSVSSENYSFCIISLLLLDLNNWLHIVISIHLVGKIDLCLPIDVNGIIKKLWKLVHNNNKKKLIFCIPTEGKLFI